MTTKYPGQLDDNNSLPVTTDLVTVINASVINNLRSCILAIESTLGTNPNSIYGSLKDRLAAITTELEAITGGVSVALGPVSGDLGGSLPSPTVVDLTIPGEQHGSILYYNGSNWVQLNPGTDGTVLTTHGVGGDPTWAADTSLLATSPPVNITKSSAVVGTAILAARSDHKHDITTATATSIGATNAEGTSTSIARADHTHSVIDLNITGQSQGSILYFNGTNWIQLSPGVDGYFLTTHSTGQNPSWTAPSLVVQSAVGLVSDWYVNASTGSDSNDGKSSGAAFKTTERLSDVLCPGGTSLNILQSVNVHVAAGSYGAVELSITQTFGSSFTFSILCDFTSSAPITLTSVTNTVESATAPVRGEITTASGAFGASNRIRSTSGAQAGAITYCTGLNGGATDAFVKTWVNSVSGTVVTITSGTTCVVDTLTVTIQRINFHGLNASMPSIIIHDAILGRLNFENALTGSSGIQAIGCQFVTGKFLGNAGLINCHFTGSFLEIIGFLQPVLFGCFCETEFFSTATSLNLVAGNCFANGGFLSCGEAGLLGYFGTELGAAEWTNGTGLTAVLVSAGGLVHIAGPQYGFGNSYSIGVNLASGAHAITDAESLLAIPATQQLIMIGNNLNYSAIPISYPNSDCSFALTSDGYSTPYIDIPGQTQGDVLYFNGTNWNVLPPSIDGYVLTTHNTGANPTWGTPPTTAHADLQLSDGVHSIVRKSFASDSARQNAVLMPSDLYGVFVQTDTSPATLWIVLGISLGVGTWQQFSFVAVDDGADVVAVSASGAYAIDVSGDWAITGMKAAISATGAAAINASGDWAISS